MWQVNKLETVFISYINLKHVHIIYQANLELNLRELLEIKNVTEIKNSMHRLNTILDRAKHKIS